MHNVFQASVPTITFWLNRRPVQALLDSGCTITLAYPSMLPHPVKSIGSLVVTCVPGDVREVPATKV